MEQAEILAKGVYPFWGRVAVLESTLDEEERTSGLILPTTTEGDEIKRGIVHSIDNYWDDDDVRTEVEKIPPGTVVYYEAKLGRKIRDLVILRLDAIVAFER